MFKKLIVTSFFLFLISFLFVRKSYSQTNCSSCYGPFSCGVPCQIKNFGSSLPGVWKCTSTPTLSDLLCTRCCYYAPTLPTPTPTPQRTCSPIWAYLWCGPSGCNSNERCDILGKCYYDSSCVNIITPTPTPIQSITIIPTSTPTPFPPTVTLIPTSTLAPYLLTPTVTLIPIDCSYVRSCNQIPSDYTCITIGQCGQSPQNCGYYECVDSYQNVKCCRPPQNNIAPPSSTPSPTPTPTPTSSPNLCLSDQKRPDGCSCTQSSQCESLFCNTSAPYNLSNGVCQKEGNPPCLQRAKCEGNYCVVSDRGFRFASCTSADQVVNGQNCCSDTCNTNKDCETQPPLVGPTATPVPPGCTVQGNELDVSTCQARGGDWKRKVPSCIDHYQWEQACSAPGSPGNAGCVGLGQNACSNSGDCDWQGSSGTHGCYYCECKIVQPNQPLRTSSPTCPTKAQGDANCDTLINDADFQLWKDEYTKRVTTLTADFNQDGKVNMIDFDIWRRNKK